MDENENYLPVIHHGLSFVIGKYVSVHVCFVFVAVDFLDHAVRAQVTKQSLFQSEIELI